MVLAYSHIKKEHLSMFSHPFGLWAFTDSKIAVICNNRQSEAAENPDRTAGEGRSTFKK
jgi:hypothetical protein